jgi:hypothetical protein
MTHEVAGMARVLAANPWVTRRPISVAEYHRMGKVGILGERDRVERIEDELVAMPASGSYHHGTAIALTQGLVRAVGRQPGTDGYAAAARVGRDGVPQVLAGVRIPAAALFR